jgi:hypothetical protein
MSDRDRLPVRSCKSVRSRMRRIRDEQAYFRIVDDFVARRVSAAVFIPRFRHLWQGDGPDRIDSAVANTHVADDHAGPYGLFAGINALCETYAYNLPDGRGYRVSEEQFRKEVQSRTLALPLSRPTSG